MAEPGEVYWSTRANQYYQAGRRGAVSRAEGARFIEYNPRLNEYYDVRGNKVASAFLEAVDRKVRRFVAHDVQGRPFLSTEFVDRSVSRQTAVQATYEGNQMVVVRTVVVTPDGKVHISYVSSPTGRTPDMQDLELKANARMKAELQDKGYKFSTNEIPGMTVSRGYIRRTVNVVKRGM